MSLSRSGQQSESAFVKLMEKFDSEHVKYYLESADRDAERAFKDAQASRRYTLVYASLVGLLFVFLVVFLSRYDAGLLKDILTAVVLLAGGFGAGYGIMTRRAKAAE